MATVSPGDDARDSAGVTATDLAGPTPSLDDRLTLLQVRMTYVAIAFGVAAFFFALVYLQLINENSYWLPRNVHQPTLLVGVFEVGLVIASGLVYFWGQWAGLYKRNFQVLNLGMWVAALLGLAAIGFHIYELAHPGFGGGHSGYGSVFVVTESVLTVLLSLTVIVLLGVANRARLGRFSESGIGVEAFGELWGFMSAVALLVFLGLYVQPFFPIK